MSKEREKEDYTRQLQLKFITSNPISDAPNSPTNRGQDDYMEFLMPWHENMEPCHKLTTCQKD
jgi:hypothetical protein